MAWATRDREREEGGMDEAAVDVELDRDNRAAPQVSFAPGNVPAPEPSSQERPRQPSPTERTELRERGRIPPSLLYVSMTGNVSEQAALQGSGARVESIMASTESTVTYNGKRYDVGPEGGGRLALVAAMNLSDDAAGHLGEMFARADKDAESSAKYQGGSGADELARLAIVFAQAERGQRRITRIALSGHHVQNQLYGTDGEGQLSWAALGELTAAFPKAAAGVEHLMVKGCFSLGEAQVETYVRMFPNLKTIWGYADTAPSAGTGSARHVQLWERATGRPDVKTIDPTIAAGGGIRDANVMTWSPGEGVWQAGKPSEEQSELAEDRAARRPEAEAAVEAQRQRFARERADRGLAPLPPETSVVTEARIQMEILRNEVTDHFLGRRVTSDPQRGALKDFYAAIQTILLRNPALDPEERTELEGVRDMIVRLRYYPNVAREFARAYHAELAAGYRALGRPLPPFATMTREEAVDEAHRVEATWTALYDQARAGATTSETFDPRSKIPRDIDRLHELVCWGLRSLQSNIIPEIAA